MEGPRGTGPDNCSRNERERRKKRRGRRLGEGDQANTWGTTAGRYFSVPQGLAGKEWMYGVLKTQRKMRPYPSLGRDRILLPMHPAHRPTFVRLNRKLKLEVENQKGFLSKSKI